MAFGVLRSCLLRLLHELEHPPDTPLGLLWQPPDLPYALPCVHGCCRNKYLSTLKGTGYLSDLDSAWPAASKQPRPCTRILKLAFSVERQRTTEARIKLVLAFGGLSHKPEASAKAINHELQASAMLAVIVIIAVVVAIVIIGAA